MKDCIFCKIIKKEIPSEILFENENVIAFKDKEPKAKVHFLIVPKQHIKSVDNLEKKHKIIVSDLIFTAQNLAKKSNLTGYKLIFNVGRGGGQLIEHLHMHLLSGDVNQLP